MDRSSKQKINKEIRALNDTQDQMDLTENKLRAAGGEVGRRMGQMGNRY